MSKRIEINSDQICFSSRCETVRFHYRRGRNHLFRYAINRLRWHRYPFWHRVTKMPEHIDLEMSNACNMQCPMCYTTTPEFKQRVERCFLNGDLWRKIIRDAAGGGVFSLRLSWRGESTLHPEFIEAIRYAKSLGICEVSTLTNALNLTPDLIESIVAAGLDWLTVSADGVGSVYESIRKPARFDDLIAKLKAFKDTKKRLKVVKPVIKVQTIWPAIQDNPDEYHRAYSAIVDQVSCNQLVDYLRHDDRSGRIVYRKAFDCPVLYQRLTIASNGFAYLCYNDEYGHHPIADMRTTSIREVWLGRFMREVRCAHRCHRGVEVFTACRHCFLPREKEVLDVVQVGAKKITIDGLQGRVQEVGK